MHYPSAPVTLVFQNPCLTHTALISLRPALWDVLVRSHWQHGNSLEQGFHNGNHFFFPFLSLFSFVESPLIPKGLCCQGGVVLVLIIWLTNNIKYRHPPPLKYEQDESSHLLFDSIRARVLGASLGHSMGMSSGRGMSEVYSSRQLSWCKPGHPELLDPHVKLRLKAHQFGSLYCSSYVNELPWPHILIANINHFTSYTLSLVCHRTAGP